jgi:hypothetical protein
VNRLCILVGTTLGGYAGWALPDYLGWGLGWCFAASSIGSLAGVWAGWKIAQRYG